MTLHCMKSTVAFHLMSLEFWLLDLILSPRTILRETGMRSGMDILDFGCGPGSFSLAATRLVGPEGRVYALDIHPLAIRYVTRKSARYGITNIYPILGSNIAELPEESIDVALLYDVLHDIPDVPNALDEIQRVLKAEGLLSVRDHHLHEKDIMAMITDGGLFRFNYRGQWTFQFRRMTRSEE